MTANSVIASAKRLMEVRHFCCNSSRMAEISVPAWPIPIHQTKLMMPKAQPTGMLLPHSADALGEGVDHADAQQGRPSQGDAEQHPPALARPAPDVVEQRIVQRLRRSVPLR